jgi:hypothetical protein
MNINDIDEINNEEQTKYRFRLGKDYSGKLLKLTLKLVQECEGKEYNVYQVCKVIDDGVTEKPTFLPLYVETFTDKQVEEFYNPPVKQCYIGGPEDEQR